MKDLTNEQLEQNWNKLISLIENTFDGEKKNYSLDTNKSKPKVDQFDDLFKDDDKDDLPF